MPRIARNTQRANLNGSKFSHAKTTQDDDDVIENEADSTQSDDTPVGPQPADALSEMMAGLQGAIQSQITVYRIVKNQPAAYVFACDPSSFSLDDLRDKYNGGEFRLYVTKEGKLYRNMRVFVEPRQVSHGNEPAAPPVTQLGEVMALMREGFAQQAAAIREVAAPRSVGSMFSGADIPAIISAMAAAITALRPPAPPPTPDVTNTALEMFMRGMEIAGDLKDRSPSDNSLGGMLREVIRSPLLAAAVQSAAVPPAAGQRPLQIAQPQPQPQPQNNSAFSHAKTPDASPPTQAETSAQDAMLAHYLGFLVGKANSGADSELYAEFVLDNLSDEQIIPMLARGEHLIEDFIKLEPRVAEQRQWFEALIRTVSDAMQPDDPSDQQPQPGVPPHAPDAAAPVVPGNAAQ